MSSTRGTYVGRTALGVSRRVTVREISEYAFASGNTIGSYTSVKWHMSPIEAAREKPFLYAILAVRPGTTATTELVSEFPDYDGATIDDPVDRYKTTYLMNVDYAAVWIVSNRTKQVICRALVSPKPGYTYGDLPCVGNQDHEPSIAPALPPERAVVEARVGNVESPQLTVIDPMEAAREVARNYPPLLRDAGVAGVVTLRVSLTPDGIPNLSDMTVVSSSHEAFADAAKRVLARLRFTPLPADQGTQGVITIRFEPRAVP